MSDEGGAIVDRDGVVVAGTLTRRVDEIEVVRLGVVSRRAGKVLGEQLVGGGALLWRNLICSIFTSIAKAAA
jgi:hypothetical protein